MESRMEELEIRLTCLDDQVDQLNRVIFQQQEKLDQLQAQLRLLWQHQENLSVAEPRDLREEIPPHY